MSIAISKRRTYSTTRKRFPDGVVGPVSLALLAFAGQLKANPVMSWLPIDPTLLMACLVLATVIASRWQHGPTTRRVAVPVALWITFLPAVALASLDDYSANKVSILFSITLVIVVAPFYLLRTDSQRNIFYITLAAIGAFTLVSTLFVNTTYANDYSNRVTLEGINTIATAQMAGAGALVCFLFAFRAGIKLWLRLVLIGAAGTMIYVALASGSRGPVAGVTIGLATVLIFSPAFRRYRGRAIALVVLAGGVAVWQAVTSGSDGFTRIFDFVNGQGDASTTARQGLWAQAWQQIQDAPLGIGWGDFSSADGVFTYPHNLLLEVGMEAGLIVGVLLAIYLVASVVRAARAPLEPTLIPVLALVVFALADAMVSSDINGDRLLWTMLSAAWVFDARTRAGSSSIRLRYNSK